MKCRRVNFPGVSVNVAVRNSVDKYVRRNIVENNRAAADKFKPVGGMGAPLVSVRLAMIRFAWSGLYHRLRQ